MSTTFKKYLSSLKSSGSPVIIRFSVNNFRDEDQDDENGMQDPLYSLAGTIKDVGEDFLSLNLTFDDGGSVAIPFTAIAFVEVDD